MRHSGSRLLLFFAILTASISAAAADLHIKVVDPHSAVVAGAQVSIYRRGEVAEAEPALAVGTDARSPPRAVRLRS